MYRFMQDVIRGMELKHVTYKMLVQMFQNRQGESTCLNALV